MERTEVVADAVARAVAECKRVRPPGAELIARREVVHPALRAEHVRVLPHGVHAVDRDAWDDDDLQVTTARARRCQSTVRCVWYGDAWCAMCLARRHRDLVHDFAGGHFARLAKGHDVGNTFDVWEAWVQPQPMDAGSATFQQEMASCVTTNSHLMQDGIQVW